MIVDIMNGTISESIGNKGKLLMLMKKGGFEIPGGFILDKDIYKAIVIHNGREKEMEHLLSGINQANIKEISTMLSNLVEEFLIPDDILEEIKQYRKAGVKYAVRSSGLMEDLDSFSFAGQYSTFLNISSFEKIAESIIRCYQSMYSESILTYLIDHDMNMEDFEMAVIIQEMIPSEKSGIAFTLNPLTGNDKEIVVEAAKGLGEEIVSGRVVPERYVYNWFAGSSHYPPENKLLTADELGNIMTAALEIQMYLGYPCDIEFAFAQNKLSILQARPITRILYSGIPDQWTTADFKDGGVSSAVCTSYMWSLYEYVWERSLKRFILDSKLLKEEEIHKLGDMFYGRPYWNMSVVKNAMAKVPGYKERDFDQDLGVKITYAGDGKTTGFSIRSISRLIRVALIQKNIVSKRNNNTSIHKKDLLEQYEQYLADSSKEYTLAELETVWYNLTKHDYLRSEGIYFWQIFINIVHQAIIKEQLLKKVDGSNYLDLIGGLDNISHLLPFWDMWDTGGKIAADQEAFKFWKEASVTRIRQEYDENSHKYVLPEFREFLKNYGYHSDKELDVAYPCYYEDIDGVIKKFKDTVLLHHAGSPIGDREKQMLVYEEELSRIQKKISPRAYNKFLKKTEEMRTMLWWREEFRDISTRFYYIIRVYTIKLANMYVNENILDCAEDIWHLKISDLWDFIDKKKTGKEIRDIIIRNKQYYRSFRNFTGEHEIGMVFDKEAEEKKAKTDSGQLTGVGCNNGMVTGRAKVVEDLEEIDRLQPGDILVTKFTDTGWTSKFAVLKGIVTEYGGILCHAAIVSREYGIPCVVSAHNATKFIKTGDMVKINGTTGEITIIDN